MESEIYIMNIENQTLSAAADLAHFRHFSSLLTKLRSTTVEIALQIRPFYAKQTQFKANSKHVLSAVEWANFKRQTDLPISGLCH
jgi:hypothetical protein